MKMEHVDHTVQSLYSTHQPTSTGSWVERRDDGAKQHNGEQMQYVRPAITTGANLPWNNSANKASFWPTRTFTNQPPRPAIILSNKQEATKLVYSKENEKGLLPRTPFEQKSHLRLSDEEDQSESETFKPKQTAAVAELVPLPQQALAPLVGSFRLEQSKPITGCSTADSTSGLPALTSTAQLPQDAQIGIPSQGLLPALGSGASQQTTRGHSIWGTSGTQTEAQTYSLQQFAPNVSDAATLDLAPRSSYASVPVNSHPLILQTSSAASMQLRMIGSLTIAQDELPIPACSPDASLQLDGSSSSQSIELGKRKNLSLGPEDDASDKESGDTMPEPRATKRRITRYPATRGGEKKSQETLERMIEKLQKEQVEYQGKWKRQQKVCSDLKSSLAATEEKLRAREDLNAKMKAEMVFLRHSLSMLSNFPKDSEASTKLSQDSSSAQQLSDEAVWMNNCSMPISMPTHDEIAAEFEMDCPLILTSSQQLLPDWKVW